MPQDTEQMPERVYVDPDIRFPECEKQYGCDVEYVRADLFDAQAAHIAALEAKVARYDAVLRSIAANTCCKACQEASLVALTALEGD